MYSITLKHDSKEFLLSLIEASTRFKMAGKENKIVKKQFEKCKNIECRQVPAKTDNAKRKTEHITLPVIKIRSSTKEYHRQDKKLYTLLFTVFAASNFRLYLFHCQIYMFTSFIYHQEYT